MINNYKKKIVIGSAQFGYNYGISNISGEVKSKNIAKIIKYGKTKGLRFIETSSSYGNAEKKLGRENLKKWKIITKVKITKIKKKEIEEEILNQITNSKKKLKINFFEAILIHNTKSLSKKQIVYSINYLRELKNKKLTGKIGFSIYGKDRIKMLVKNVPFDILQTSINLIDRRILNEKILRYIKKNKIKIHARSVFLQGLLAKKNKKKLPLKIRKIWKVNKPIFNKYLYKKKINHLQACLSFVLNQNSIEKVIIGFDDLVQFKEVMGCKITKNRFEDIKVKNRRFLINPYLWDRK